MLTRIIRIINVTIAIVVVLIAAAVYWFAMRPLPKTSGEITAPIHGPATIRRDARGIPHIEASSWQDAVFLQGFATAQDRLWQMDGLRRYGAGELAEVFGPGALREDERARSMRMRAIAEAGMQHVTPDQRALFVEYARGVNYFINTHRGNYSLEFALPGHSYEPKPWTVVDSLVVGLVMYRQLSDTAGTDLSRGALIAFASDPTKMRTLFPPVEGGSVSPGSNAWAVSGAHTRSGKPLLANDTHLEYGIPPTWHLVHLKAPGLNVSGCALPGVPGVIIGHNENIAWGATNLEADTMDLYVEQIDPQSGRYAYRGHLEQAQLHSEVIAVRGSKPVQWNTWVTRHGPVIAFDRGRGYSLRWSANDGFSFPFWNIDRARNWTEFRTAVATFWGPVQNFIYADNTGAIAYQAGGRIPIRRGFDGDVPLDGASGSFEWDGYIPFDQLPSIYNPPAGIVATSNQNPFPPGYPYRIDGSFADAYRVKQVRALLRSKSELDVADMLAIQKDVYAAYDYFLARQAVGAVANRTSSDLVRQAVDVLRRWNGQMEKDQPAPVIVELLNNEIRSSLVMSLVKTPQDSNHTQARSLPTGQTPTERAGSRPTAQVKGQFIPAILPGASVVESLLRNRPAGWVPGNDWDGWLCKSLESALEQGRQRQGTPVSSWRWGRMLQWNIAHPVANQFPPLLHFLRGYFNIGPVEMSGASTSVKQTTTTLGPSERLVVDLGNLENSVVNITTGESGMVASTHYKDEWPAYYAGQSFPMQFQHIETKEVLQVRPETH